VTGLVLRTCALCLAGRHEDCGDQMCSCLEPHPGDSSVMLGFKRLKKMPRDEQRTVIREILGRIRPAS
jgi:hypothetical protein